MTAISVWERKKERKKGKEARMATAAMCMMDDNGFRARGESDVWLMMTMMMTTYH